MGGGTGLAAGGCRHDGETWSSLGGAMGCAVCGEVLHDPAWVYPEDGSEVPECRHDRNRGYREGGLVVCKECGQVRVGQEWRLNEAARETWTYDHDLADRGVALEREIAEAYRREREAEKRLADARRRAEREKRGATRVEIQVRLKRLLRRVEALSEGEMTRAQQDEFRRLLNEANEVKWTLQMLDEAEASARMLDEAVAEVNQVLRGTSSGGLS